MISRSLDEIEAADIFRLIELKVSERRTLEYKQALPSASDKDVREFLADVTSFANALGGDIVFGVTEERDEDGLPTGIPKEAVGLPITNFDAQILRLESICRDSISPRLVGQRFRSIEGFPSGPVLVVRIPKSYAAPHMVNPTSRFYSRHSAGKYPLDVSEIRRAFLESDSIPQALKEFRSQRLQIIEAQATPISIPGKNLVVLHLVPASALAANSHIDVTSVTSTELPTMAARSWTNRLNFDGLLVNDTNFYYAQLFRTGALEVVDSYLLSGQPGAEGRLEFWIPARALEQYLREALQKYSRLVTKLELNPPWFFCVSLLGVKGHRLAANQHTYGREPIDRHSLIFPEVVVDSETFEESGVVRPVLEQLWQAAGLYFS